MISRKDVLSTFFIFFYISIILTGACSKYDYHPQYPSSANAYQKEFLYVVNVLKEAHPGTLEYPLPFEIHNKWNKEVKTTYEYLGNVSTDFDFLLTVLKFLSKLNDGHTFLTYDKSHPIWCNSLQMPLEFAIYNDRLYIVLVDDAKYIKTRLSEVKYINDTEAKEIIKIAKRYSIGDNAFGKSRIDSFATSLLKYYDFYRYNNIATNNKSIIIRYIDAHGNDESIEVALSKKKPKKTVREIVNLSRNTITRLRSKNNIRYISKISAIYVNLSHTGDRDVEDFVDSVFIKAVRMKARNIVLDIRDNLGGNTKWCFWFLGHLIKRELPIKFDKGWERDGDKNRSLTGEGFFLPRKPFFDGRLFVLMGNRTLSASTFCVSSIRINKFGKIIGEPSGQNRFSYGETKVEFLPHTKGILVFSTKVIERAVDRNRKPLEPDVYVGTTIDDIRQHRDPVYNYVVDRLLSDK